MSDEIRAITLKCASCGAALEISNDTKQFACGYCGAQQIVERRGGIVVLKLITDAISMVQAGTDKTAAELAIKRLSEELANTEAEQRVAVVKLKAMNEFSQSESGVFGCLILIIVGVVLALPLPVFVKTVIFIGIGGLSIAAVRQVSSQKYQDSEPVRSEIKEMQTKIEAINIRLAKQRAIADS